MTIPSRTFVMRPNRIGYSVGPFQHHAPGENAASKQNCFLHDGRRNVIVSFSGDSEAGFGTDWLQDHMEVFSYDAALDMAGDSSLDPYGRGKQGWRMLTAHCSGPGKITPNQPNDGSMWAYDMIRDRYWAALPGGFPVGQAGTVCPFNAPSEVPSVSGSIITDGLMYLDPVSHDWISVRSDLIASPFKGRYDPVTDRLYGFQGSGGGDLYWVQLNNNPASITTGSVAYTAGMTPGYFSGPGPNYGPAQMMQQDFSIDVISRWGYTLCSHDIWINGDNTGTGSFLKFCRFSLDDPSVQQELAPIPAALNNPNHYIPTATAGTIKRTFFVTRKRKLVWFAQYTQCGTPHAICVYDPRTNAWDTSIPIQKDTPSVPVTGQAGFYDPSHDVIVMGGGTFCGLESDPHELEGTLSSTHYSLWRL